jgi:hypothetical protein
MEQQQFAQGILLKFCCLNYSTLLLAAPDFATQPPMPLSPEEQQAQAQALQCRTFALAGMCTSNPTMM